MNPTAFAARGNRNVLDFGDRNELAGFNAGNQFADVQMDVALRLDAGRVIRDGPLVSEQRFRFGDGGGPQLSALLAIQLVDRALMRTREREPSIWFSRVGILEEEDPDIGGLLLRFPAQAALARFESFRSGWIAIAGDEVRTQSQRCEQRHGNQESSHSQSLYLDLFSFVQKRWALLLVGVAGLYFLYFFGLTRTGLLGPDEPRYAAIGRAMAESGDWVTPKLWGERWFEKPALLYWMTAAGFKAGLDLDLAPRLPVAIASVAFLIYFFGVLRGEFGDRAAFYATTILATSAGWLAYSHVAVTDLPMSAAFAGAMLAVMSGRGRILAGVLLGAAMLAKGLVPLALFLPALWFWRKRVSDLLVLLAVAFLVAAPWYVLVTLRNGAPFLEDFFWKQHFARYLTGALQHERPFWFYLPVLVAGLFPWTPLLWFLFEKRIYEDTRAKFLLAWLAWGFLFFSISRNKLPGYVLPLLPAAAALIGIAIAEAKPRSIRMACLLGACTALLTLTPMIGEILPPALVSGLSNSGMFVLVVSSGWVISVLLVTLGCGFLEWKGRREWAIAAIALLTAVAVARLISDVYPALDREASARVRWRSSPDSITCVSNDNRSLRYGLSYYANRSLPDCN